MVCKKLFKSGQIQIADWVIRQIVTLFFSHNHAETAKIAFSTDSVSSAQPQLHFFLLKMPQELNNTLLASTALLFQNSTP